MKIDLKKAYDSIEWNFVEDMLFALKFPAQMINWIMQCVTTPSYTLSLNGYLFRYFKWKRGLRQGDPMSPLLFTICLEYLTRILAVVTLRVDFRFHPLCRAMGLCHLAFTDDLLLFCRDDGASVMVLMRALQTFSGASGLTINKGKSDIYMNGLSGGEEDQILLIFGIFLLPKGIIKRVDAICRNYLWSGIDDFHMVPAVSWDKCSQAKEKGGLGVKNCYLWNVAIIGEVRLVKDKLRAGLDVLHWLQKPYSIQVTYDWLLGYGEKRLLKYGVMSDGLCCICASAQETQDHFFLLSVQYTMHAAGSAMAWTAMACGLSCCPSGLKVQEFAEETGNDGSIACLVYHIWLRRNQARHEGSVPRPGVVLHQMQNMVKYRLF
ncbi:uncharacterized protein LOC141590521 [Silene latifolia]|uniref:uncharacterized protein LOC141590521 n=1 Tax=Silene latifolia TaxID=37657 RepID=UPI003D76BF89